MGLFSIFSGRSKHSGTQADTPRPLAKKKSSKIATTKSKSEGNK